MADYKIYTPLEAITQNSALVIWDKMEEGENTLKYEVFVNGKLYNTVQCTDETLVNLKPDSDYSIQIRTTCNGRVYETNEIRIRTKQLAKVYNINDFGAKSGKGLNNTKAIQRAIDMCEKGGIVFVPKGEYYTGALFLHSDMTLELDEGAKLISTGVKEDFKPFYYPFEGRWEMCYASLLNVKNLSENDRLDSPQYKQDIYENISIIGKGIIDGGGEALFHSEMKDHGSISRGRTVCIRNTTNVYIYGVTIQNSPSWCLHNIYCKNMTINQISLLNKFDENGIAYTHFNGDGIDPDSCENVIICHSFIESQDDSIALKSGREPLGLELSIPTRNVRVSNCSLSYGFGIVVGSEMSGGVMNVLVQDITAKETLCAINLKTKRGRGAVISDIIYENIHLKASEEFNLDDKWFRGALCIDQFYGDDNVDDTVHEPDIGTSTISGIIIKNIELESMGRPGIYIYGLPEKHIKNVVLSNVSIHSDCISVYKNVDDIICENVKNIM